MEANIDRNFGHRPKESDDNGLVRPVDVHVGELDWSSSAQGILFTIV